MSNNSLGKNFAVTSFGESHGPVVGCVVDGCLPGFKVDMRDLQLQLNRRRPGQSKITSSRAEGDTLEILSGVHEGVTTGAPICMIIKNTSFKKSDYANLKDVFRPSHADFTYQKKYGHRDPYGGGRASARVTAGWVAAGALANQILLDKFNITITAYVSQIHRISMPEQQSIPSRHSIDKSIVRCPHDSTSGLMLEAISKAKAEENSLGGIISCYIEGCPVGVGEPVFNKLQAQLSFAMMNINAVKGFEYGSGFESTSMKGSEANDLWSVSDDGQPYTETNHSGGIQGGISNGMPIYFKVAFKPTSSIGKRQKTLSKQLESTEIEVKGRHDPCVVPRAVPIVESLAAIVLLDNLVHKQP